MSDRASAAIAVTPHAPASSTPATDFPDAHAYALRSRYPHLFEPDMTVCRLQGVYSAGTLYIVPR